MKPIRKSSTLVLIAIVTYFSMAVGSCDKYQKCGQLAKDVAAGVLLAQQTEIQLHQNGQIDNTAHVAIQQKFVQLADAGVALDSAINQVHSASNAKAALQQALIAVQAIQATGAAGIKSDSARLAFQASVLAVQTTLNNIVALSGGK